MPGLLTAQNVPTPEHFLEDIAIAHRSTSQLDAFTCEHAFQAEIGHGCGDNAGSFELALRFQETSDGQQNTVAVDDASRLANKQGAVGVAVEGHTKRHLFLEHP